MGATRTRHESERESGVRIELDPDRAARLKAARNRRLHTVQIPVLRVVGITFFAAGVGLHNALVQGEVSWPTVLTFGALAITYSLLSWLALARWYGRTAGVNLGDVFLVVDIFFLVLTVYLSGGEQSWIFFVLLGRVADQAVGGFRRAAVFAHLCLAGYVLMLLWITVIDGRALPVAPTAAKIVFFYLAAWYITLYAIPVEKRRRSIGTAIATARDLIGRLRVTTQALEEARLKAEEASEAKSRFLGTMSHEVRTPLSAVIGMADLLEHTDLDEQQKDMVARIRDGGAATLQLVSDVLELAALDQGQAELRRVPFAPAALVNDIVRMYRPAAESKGLELITEVDERVPEAVTGDSVRTRHLLRVLVDNAVKFTLEGRVTVSCAVHANNDQQVWLRWTVKDTGVGFDASELQRLQEPFVQADGSPTRRFEGAGLGLALAGRMTEAMGGTLDATSSKEEGSTFWVDLPLEATPPAP